MQKIFFQKAFTLVELIVSITILSMILISVFTVYTNIIQINKQLQVTRIVQENSRKVTEEIATDVREKGIDLAYYDGTIPATSANYTGSGTQILAIQGGIKYYPMKIPLTGGLPVLCTESEQQDPSLHCFIGKEDSGIKTALSDDRVRVENIRFFVSGNIGNTISNTQQEGKVTIILSLGIEYKAGVMSQLSKSAHVPIETTISEKVYKK